MNKYDISRDDWNSPINILYNKIDLYSTQHTLLDDICVSTSIRELCESRDSEYTNFFDRNLLFLLLSCHQTAFFHLSTHFLAFSLNF